ncbi:ARM repeat-containing protein [Ganoderma leucocontextum]|nr:ARM repeat-containing protein [Ganoderma leucocontextum]
MGILLSILFPPLFMSSQFDTTSSTPDDSRSSSPVPDISPSIQLFRHEEDIPDPSPPTSPKSSLIASPPLDTRPYSPHGVGIGILSPQPVLGPFAPISRADLAPLQVRSSPVEQRSNPLESIPPRQPPSPFEQPYPSRASGSRSPEFSQPSPPLPHSLRYVEEASKRDGYGGEHCQLAGLSSAGASGQGGLRISIPPPNPTASTSTPSPPLLLQPPQDPLATSLSSTIGPGPSGAILESLAPPPTVDSLGPSSELNIDFTEFDTEGCSALEKIYLFSRSRASFHRVFIVHALPQYLQGAETSSAELPSREIIEQIKPAEAVEYILPLLNGLAMDEDEAVKEALAAELVPIIWWFVTYCRLVDDDTVPPSPPAPPSVSPPASGLEENERFLQYPASPWPEVSSDHDDAAISGDGSVPVYVDHESSGVTIVPVQAFTPILGTLLLSPNGLVGGSARYAVVELLRRLRRADERDAGENVEATELHAPLRPGGLATAESPCPDTEGPLEVGLFGWNERRLFERELVYQVVIGMGRLDLDDNRGEQQADDLMEAASVSGASTAVPTPQAVQPIPELDSYFPLAASFGITSAAPPTVSSASPPVLTAEVAAIGVSTISPAASPSPPVSSTSPVEGSPDHSSASTPSLTSSASSSSGEYSDHAELNGSDRFSLGLSGTLPAADDSQAPMLVDEVLAGPSELKPFPMTQNHGWAEPSSPSRSSALPTTPPFEVLPPPPVAAPVPVAAEATVPLSTFSSLPSLFAQAPAASESPPRPQVSGSGWISPKSAARELAGMDEQMDDSADLSEEASVGRLSCMSLMAAVTASGSIADDTKRAFVTEVERVGRDPVYWVRREASFAVGALAKVVPVEVVTSSLLPLFEFLCQDSTWHVRHSVLFALPAILSRLTPEHRRNLALDVILPLSQDEEPTVRSAVLEALGEVMYTFADDEDGPPEPLLKLFLGVRETQDPGGGQLPSEPERLPVVQVQEIQSAPPQSATSVSATSSAWSDYGTDAGGGPDIYEDPQRPLICAFNYPAVALTLGRQRWPELRTLYLSLAQDPMFKTRRTLAASLGEIAKIVGEGHAAADLLAVFWSSLHADEGEVRTKVIEALPTFARALALPERSAVANGLAEAFSSGKLSSWRERESAVKALGGLVELEGVSNEVLHTMLVKALEDPVAAVREAAVFVLPAFLNAWKDSPTLLEALGADIRAFAGSASFRRRTTYVMCIQEMLLSEQGHVVVRSETFWDTVGALVRDPIVDVRIRVARLLGLISDKFSRADTNVAVRTITFAQELATDSSHEVQAFAAAVLAGASMSGIEPSRLPVATLSPPVGTSTTTFSRPPPIPS